MVLLVDIDVIWNSLFLCKRKRISTDLNQKVANEHTGNHISDHSWFSGEK